MFETWFLLFATGVRLVLTCPNVTQTDVYFNETDRLQSSTVSAAITHQQEVFHIGWGMPLPETSMVKELSENTFTCPRNQDATSFIALLNTCMTVSPGPVPESYPHIPIVSTCCPGMLPPRHVILIFCPNTCCPCMLPPRHVAPICCP